MAEVKRVKFDWMIKVKPVKNPIKETKDRGIIAWERLSVPQGIGEALSC